MKRASHVLLAALLGAVLTLAGCEELLPKGTVLPFGDKTSPYYWGDLFLDLYADELVVGELEEGPEPLEEPRVVLLITGVTIPAQWFDPIVARLERDGFVPVVYEPPELLSYDLFEAAEDLAEVVEEVREESGQDRIDILAECTGGVVARHYVQSMGGDALVSRLVTFVSPHQGVDKAQLAAFIVGWPALHDLTPGSEFLEAVNGAPLPETVPVTSIYTCSDEYIQPWQGSIVPGANNIGLCDGTVGHFQTFYDPEIYLIMHGALTEPAGFEPEPEPEPADEPTPEDDATPPADDAGAELWAEPVADDTLDDLDSSLGADAELEAWEADPSAADEEVGCSGGGPTPAPYLVLLVLFGLVSRRLTSP